MKSFSGIFKTKAPLDGLSAKEISASDKLASSGSSSSQSLVKIENLKVIYNPGKTNEAQALKGVDIEIFPQEYIMFFGPSGCGKSTLLNIIAGLEVPSQGTVVIDGQDISQFSYDEMAIFHRKKIGMVFQAYNLIPTLSVYDNIIVPQIFERVPFQKRRERGEELLAKLGLEKMGKRLPQELSGGQQQRVGIARALVNDPPVILADEAVGNLDSESAKNVLEILNRLNTEEKKTIIAVTHNPEHLFYADRVFYMKDGQVIKVEVNEKKQAEKKEENAGAQGQSSDQEKYDLPGRERTDLDLLLQSYPDLSSMQLHVMLAPFKAKMLAGYLLSQFESGEVERLEGIITDRLMERTKKEDVTRLLDISWADGGLGLNIDTARKFSKTIEDVVEKANFIKSEYSSGAPKETDKFREMVVQIRRSLLDELNGDLTLSQIESLDNGIEHRILNKLSRGEFQEYLDRSFKSGGVGLNRKTARRFARKLELIILVEFGNK